MSMYTVRVSVRLAEKRGQSTKHVQLRTVSRTFSYYVRIVGPPDFQVMSINKTKKKTRAFSPQANYTDPATAACQRS
jgi:hypothetical protein